VNGRGDFIGNGWGFPAAITRGGSVRLFSGTAELDAAIRMILSTMPGERVMRPDFGCDIWGLAFAPLTPGTLGLMEQAVRESIERWEPRIALDRVNAIPNNETATVMIEIDYRVRATNETRNLVYPFYSIPTGEPES